jgi:hypothetical protein
VITFIEADAINTMTSPAAMMIWFLATALLLQLQGKHSCIQSCVFDTKWLGAPRRLVWLVFWHLSPVVVGLSRNGGD